MPEKRKGGRRKMTVGAKRKAGAKAKPHPARGGKARPHTGGGPKAKPHAGGGP